MNIQMEKIIEIERNIILMEILNIKENIQLEKKMGKEKNILIMVN